MIRSNKSLKKKVYFEKQIYVNQINSVDGDKTDDAINFINLLDYFENVLLQGTKWLRY